MIGNKLLYKPTSMFAHVFVQLARALRQYIDRLVIAQIGVRLWVFEKWKYMLPTRQCALLFLYRLAM